MSADFALPEIAEAEATGEIADLYETIRADTGSSLVNYVWRHLATIEGAAPWLWQATRYNDSSKLARLVSGIADASAVAVAEETRPAVPPKLGEAAGEILGVYNANNASNLARVTLLLAVLRQPEANATAARPPVRAQEPVGGDLPPLPRFSELSQTDLSAIAEIADAGPASESGIVPSLWRHLAVEPGLVPTIRDPLVSMLGSPAFTTAFGVLRARVEALGAAAAPAFPPRPDFDRAAALEGLSRFSRRIAELTLAGRVLAEWTAPSAGRPHPQNGARP